MENGIYVGQQTTTSEHNLKRIVKREHKGKSLLIPTANYVVIDIETTGLDPMWDSIIELGAIRYRGDKAVSEFSTLINPGFEIDEFISELTGITNSMLSSAPSLDRQLPAYMDYIGSDIIVGHNVNFDINFLYDSSESYGLSPVSNDFIDTMHLSRRLFSEYKHHRLCDLVARFAIDHLQQHRVLSDCNATAEAYQYMKAYMQQNGISFESLFPHRVRSAQALKAADIVPSTDAFDESHPLFGKICVFTGSLQHMLRKEAMQTVVNLGGICEDRVTKHTNYLILGNNDYCTTIKDGKSNKQKTAERYKLAGQDIDILSEAVFYDLLICQ